MNVRVEQTPETNLNLVLSVSKDGTVLYSNDAGEPLLNEWGMKVGEKLPSNIVDLVKRVIFRNSPERIEVKVGKKVYLVVFSPLPEQECINISGFDESDLKVLDERFYENKTREINLELAEIVDVQAIQSLMDDFYKFAHITIAMVDLKGNILVSVGWQDICTKFHRVHPVACSFCVESDTKLSAGVPIGEFKLYKCKNNMWDIATPIIVGGIHLGNIFSGQFFFEDEPLDYELFRSQARLYGFNEEEYMAALEKVPRMSREAVETSMSFFMKLANMISQLSFSNIKLAQSLVDRDTLVEELQVSEERLHRMSHAGHIGLYEWNTDRDMVYFSPKAYELYGCDPNTLVTHENWLMRIHPDDRTMVEQNIEKAHDNARNMHDNSSRYEFRVVHVDGTVLWLEAESTYYLEGCGLIARGAVRDITEKKRVEKALKESEAKANALIQYAPTGIYEIDYHGPKILTVNDAMCTLSGYTREELLSMNPTDLLVGESKKLFTERVKCLLAGEKINNEIDLNVKKKDGSLINVALNIAFSKDNPYTALVIGHDVTERKCTEEALRESELKYRALSNTLEEKVKERTDKLEIAYNSLKESEERLTEAQEIAHLGNWERNLVTGDLYWSKEMYRIFGRNPLEGAPGYNVLFNYIHPEDRDYMNKKIKRALNGESYSTDHRIILQDGEERLVHVHAEVVFDEKNIPVQIRGTVQDLTESKKAEEQIQNFANIVESSNDAIGTMSLDGIITSWNKEAEKIYGYSVKEILGISISILAPPHLDKETINLIEKVKHGEKIQYYETTRLRKDGKIIYVSFTLSPVFNIHGKMTAISFISRDTTERKKAEEALIKIEIARKQEIHHRIKNNLQVISSLLDLQADKFKHKKFIKKSNVLKAFRESQDRVISMALIHEELYKGGQNNTISFPSYVKELTDNLFLTYTLGNNKVRLHTDLEENIFFDMDTAVPLGLIINELISNSLKHAFPSRDEGEIKIKLFRDETRECKSDVCNVAYVLSISDNGISIPEDLDIEDLDSLGLQLVTTLVEQLDGELELKRDNGTEFNIRFAVTERDNQVSKPAPLLVDND